MPALRLVLVGLGAVVAGYGGFLLVSRQDGGDLVNALVWLGAGVVLHDGVLAPLTIAVTVLAVRLLPAAWRRPAIVALIVLGPLTLLTVPVLGSFGASPDDPGLLERPYVTAWLVLVAVTVLAVAAVGFLGGHRADSEEEEEGSDGTRPRR